MRAEKLKKVLGKLSKTVDLHTKPITENQLARFGRFQILKQKTKFNFQTKRLKTFHRLNVPKPTIEQVLIIMMLLKYFCY